MTPEAPNSLRVKRLQESADSSNKDDKVGTSPVEQLTVGPYRIERELGRGGMGVVFLATRADQEYRKQVAIKLIHGRPGEQLAERFRAERQILATLEHPNIARLLDGGTTPDGDPYLAMEYVRGGRPIDEWCRQDNPSLPVRLEKFLDICSAVQHAHQHLIVHRDLKPGNILVSPDGEVKLLDFGLARPLAPVTQELSAAAARSVAGSMTPDYASPEQQAGLPVGTSSDIYSLGVILFEMLTGERPYPRQKPKERSISWTDSHSPRSAEPSIYAGQTLTLRSLPDAIPADLGSIILMALRQDPDRRYASASEMRRDIERFLEGRPVHAHPNRFPYPLWKFVTRHKWAIAACVLLAASLAGGIVATIRQSQLAEARARDADAQRRLAESNAAEAQRLRSIAEQQATLVQERGNEAVEQRDQTLKLATSLIRDLDDPISRLPGSLPARKQLVSRSVEALEQLHLHSPGNAKVLVRLAGAYQSLGAIQRSRFASSLGDSAGALKSYQRSLDFIREAEASASPDERDEIEKSYASVWFGFGDLHDIAGERKEALAAYNKGLAHAVTAASHAAGKAGTEDSLALLRLPMMGHKKCGDVLRVLERWTEAENHYRQAAAISDSNAKAHPLERTFARDRLVSLSSLALLYKMRQQLPEALAQYERCIRLTEQAVAAFPNDAPLHRDLFVYLCQAGEAKTILAAGDSGKAYLERALSIAEARFQSEGGNLQSIYDLCDAHYNLSHSLQVRGDADESRRHLMISGELARRAAGIDPAAHQTKHMIRRYEEALAASNPRS